MLQNKLPKRSIFWVSGELQTENNFSKLKFQTQSRSSKSIPLAQVKDKVEVPLTNQALKTPKIGYPIRNSLFLIEPEH